MIKEGEVMLLATPMRKLAEVLSDSIATVGRSIPYFREVLGVIKTFDPAFSGIIIHNTSEYVLIKKSKIMQTTYFNFLLLFFSPSFFSSFSLIFTLLPLEFHLHLQLPRSPSLDS